MPTAPLPENPSLEHLKGQAKLVRDLVRAGDEGALGMVDDFHPRLDSVSLADAEREPFKTTDAQLIVARMYGFASWPQLRQHLSVVAEHSLTPLPEDADLAPADAFIVAACLDYAKHGPSPQVRLAEAHRMLIDDPSLATGSVAAMATVGDHAGLASALDANGEAIDSPCGPNQWPPLLYATFSRVDAGNPAWSSHATVELLLDRGADPNAGFLWCGLVPPFTALTGALGGGESHQPWHADRLEIARLLLDAGADPNDGQALYNNGIGGQDHDNPAHLELLVEYGLGSQRNGPWYQRLGNRLRDPAELLYDELEAAAKRNRPTTLRYLLSMGLDATRPIGRSQLPLVRIAAGQSHDAILGVLAEHDIDTDLTPVEQAVSVTRTNDVESLDELLSTLPELLADLLSGQPGLCNNVASDHTAMLTRLVELGFDINDRSTTKTPLHHAAEAGDTARARLLLDHGADPNLTDTHIGATPWGWANHSGHTDTAAELHPLTDHGDTLPEITITSPSGTRTLATPNLIDGYLDQLHRGAAPVLATLRHRDVALTIGVGHPNTSVALYLDADGTPWHGTGARVPAEQAAEIPWRMSTGEDQIFYPHASVTPAFARSIAREFVDSPTTRPPIATWRKEGDTSAMAPSFDLPALCRAVDDRRKQRDLSWAALARQTGVAASTMRRWQHADDAEADGVLAVIRWLDVAPESFVTGGTVEPTALPPTNGGFIRVEMDLVSRAAGDPGGARGRTRTTIQRLVEAAESSGKPIAGLTRLSDT